MVDMLGALELPHDVQRCGREWVLLFASERQDSHSASVAVTSGPAQRANDEGC
jgi:hypothetical protein